MKRVYTKPDVVFESFSLSSSITANCAKEANFSSGQCGFEYTDEMTIFMNSIQGCTFIESDGNWQDRVCYHNPYDWNNLFNS